MSPIDWAKEPIRNYATFSGRASRSEYWWFYLAYIIASFIGGIIDAIIGFRIFGVLLAIGLLIPILAVGVRRLHDTGRSGWWLAAPFIALIPLIPLVAISGGTGGSAGAGLGIIIGSIVFFGLAITIFIFTVLRGDDGTNDYGPSPL